MYSDTLCPATDRLARLGALGHLDLDLVGIDQVFGGHAKAAGSNLLDGGTQESPSLKV
jgi:nanoRNase/pAp phosphatase (c-di-AMP/oligoRNAs hydrolase)